MLVTIGVLLPWHCRVLVVWLLCTACSVVVGPLPEALPEDGPMAGDGSQFAGTPATSGAGGGAPGGTGGKTAAGGSDCDGDGDGHDAEGSCGGDDCDDADERVHPGQTSYYSERQERVGFDYDCSGRPEPEHQRLLMCTGLALAACPTDDSGFLDELPACGEPGSWGTCQTGTVACEEQVLDELPMRCH